MIKITGSIFLVSAAFGLLAVGVLPKEWWKLGEALTVVTGAIFLLAIIWS